MKDVAAELLYVLQRRCIDPRAGCRRNRPATDIRGGLGYADSMRFDADALAWLDETREIEIETAAPSGPAHRTIIWVVVDGGDAFIRSANGDTARWYREAIANPAVTLHARGRGPARAAVTARVEAAMDADSIERTSDAFRRKYAGTGGSLATMLKAEILDTTLRLAPD
jgi:hypothetical protein